MSIHLRDQTEQRAGERRFNFPEHPFSPHPWSSRSAWGSTIVLQINKPETTYGVWKIFETDGTFRHWYFNFEAPRVRTARAGTG